MIKHSIYLFIIISLLTHVSFFGGLSLVNSNKPSKKEVITVDFLDEASSDKKKFQIVEQNKKSLNDEIDLKAKYLSQTNQRVVEQTQANNTGKFRNANGFGNHPSIVNNPKPQKQLQNKANGGVQQLTDLAPDYDYSNISAGLASTSDDHLTGVKKGVETLLSTREFVYYTFYSRIKQKLRRHWGVKVRERIQKLARKGRRIASNENQITKIIITLNQGGSLVHVQVKSRSGIYDLDQAAVEAFKAAAPFPNPPKGMINDRGLVVIHWDFVLEA